MAKKYYDFQIGLNINGKPYLSEQVYPLFQRDPFPGGHEYSCVISGSRLGKYFADLPHGRNQNVSEADARRFFLSLVFGWEIAHPEIRNVEYFLNSVEVIDFDGERI